MVDFATSDWPVPGGLNIYCGSLNKTKNGTELVCHIFCRRFSAGSKKDEKTEQDCHHL